MLCLDIDVNSQRLGWTSGGKRLKEFIFFINVNKFVKSMYMSFSRSNVALYLHLSLHVLYARGC
jgi:hypothetical protein